MDIYCNAVTGLTQDLNRADLRSHGLLAFRDYLASYTKSPEFAQLLADTHKLKDDLSGSHIELCTHAQMSILLRPDSCPSCSARKHRSVDRVHARSYLALPQSFAKPCLQPGIACRIGCRCHSPLPGYSSPCRRRVFPSPTLSTVALNVRSAALCVRTPACGDVLDKEGNAHETISFPPLPDQATRGPKTPLTA